jgi:ABC-type phosphate/phosphonate transport system permease subunit
MMKFIRDLFTEDDGVSWCLAKVSAFIALVSYLSNATYSVYLGHTLDLSAFGTGLAAVLAGGAALIAAKQATQKS